MRRLGAATPTTSSRAHRAAAPPPALKLPRLDYPRQSAAVVVLSTCRAAEASPSPHPLRLIRLASTSIFPSSRTKRRVREDRSGGKIHSRGLGHTLTIAKALLDELKTLEEALSIVAGERPKLE